MENLLKEMQAWMQAYMKTFYTTDEKIQKAVKIKEMHTGFVMRYCRDLARHLGYSAHDRLLAEMMGLFHDIGRFEQFTKYQTFNDAQSEDHGHLGVMLLRQHPLILQLSPKDQQDLLFAIQNHNKKQIPQAEDSRQEALARLLRDADKLDIYRVLSPYLLPSDGTGFSTDFLRRFLAGEQCDYTAIRTADDRKLVRLMWLYDINYGWTMRQILGKGYMEKILACLPESDTLRQGGKKLQDYVQAKAAQRDARGF